MTISAASLLKGLLIVPFVYLIADFYLVWFNSEGTRAIYRYFNSRDFFFVGLLVLPAIVSHIVTIWGHYYRADSHFQKSIVKVVSGNEEDDLDKTKAAKRGSFESPAKEKKKKTTSIWERHDPWKGWTVKVWVLVAICVLLNFVWFIQPLIAFLPRGIRFRGVYAGVTGKNNDRKKAKQNNRVLQRNDHDLRPKERKVLTIFFWCLLPYFSLRRLRQRVRRHGKLRDAPTLYIAALHVPGHGIHVCRPSAVTSRAGSRLHLLEYTPRGLLHPLLCSL